LLRHCHRLALCLPRVSSLISPVTRIDDRLRANSLQCPRKLSGASRRVWCQLTILQLGGSAHRLGEPIRRRKGSYQRLDATRDCCHRHQTRQAARPRIHIVACGTRRQQSPLPHRGEVHRTCQRSLWLQWMVVFHPEHPGRFRRRESPEPARQYRPLRHCSRHSTERHISRGYRLRLH
jgi:hypothetical protein